MGRGSGGRQSGRKVDRNMCRKCSSPVVGEIVLICMLSYINVCKI